MKPQWTNKNLNLADATSYTSCDPTKAVKIRLNDGDNDFGDYHEYFPPTTIPERFTQVAKENPDVVALKYQIYDEVERYKGVSNGQLPSLQNNHKTNNCNKNLVDDMDDLIKLPWYSKTYSQYLNIVRQTAKAFIAVGLERYHSVGIMGYNSPEWFYSNFGAIFAGGLSTAIYATNNPETCFHILHDSKANVVVVGDAEQMQKILQIRHRLPLLKVAIQYSGNIKHNDPFQQLQNSSGDCNKFRILTWEEFLEKGQGVTDETLDNVIVSIKANMCCTLIYTSGTTGDPKGVMLSHDNILWTSRKITQLLGFRRRKEVTLTYLPLSHIAAQLLDSYTVLDTASLVYFSHPSALKGTLIDYLRVARPTIFVGVPRVWEKIEEKMQAVSRQTTQGWKKKIAVWAKRIGTQGSDAKMRGKTVPWVWQLANLLVYRKIRKALGLDRAHLIISAGAALSSQTRLYFDSLNLQIMEIYGMSECSGPATINFNSFGKYWGGSVGLAVNGTQVTVSKSRNEDDCGEILIRGRHVFMGYINKEKETCEVLGEDGWLKSGDLGNLQITPAGTSPFLFITGRKKELIITAGGENIAPIPIESAVKEELKDFVSNAMVIGDYKKYLSILLTVRTEIDWNSDPTDELTQEAQKWISHVMGQELTDSSLSRLLNRPDKPELDRAIENAISRVNEKGVSRAANIRKWRILPRDFSLNGGELGPTLKLKRPVVSKMYLNLIESIYDGHLPQIMKSHDVHAIEQDKNYCDPCSGDMAATSKTHLLNTRS